MMNHVTKMSDDNFCEYLTLAKFAAETATNLSKDTVVIVHVHTASLETHFNDLKLFLNQFSNKVELLCISETRLTDRHMKFCDLPGYILRYRNYNTNAGGSAIYVAQDADSYCISN